MRPPRLHTPSAWLLPALVSFFVLACHPASETASAATGTASDTFSSSSGNPGTGSCSTGAGGSGPCAGSVSFQGNVEGQCVAGSTQFVAGHAEPGGEIAAISQPSCGGIVMAIPTTSGMVGGPVTALFDLPPGVPHAGEWFCAGAGSTAALSAGSYFFHLASLASLGGCPGGTPVTGDVSGCIGSKTQGQCSGSDSSLTSTIGGASFDWKGPVLSYDVFQQTYLWVGFALPGSAV